MANRRRFWEVIIDRKAKTFEVLGVSSDDTLLTDNVATMIKAGMDVACNTPDSNIPKEELTITGYQSEAGVYDRLLSEYFKISKKHLRRW